MDRVFLRPMDVGALDAALTAVGLVKPDEYTGCSANEKTTTVFLVEGLGQDRVDLADATVIGYALALDLSAAKVRRVLVMKLACRDFIEAHMTAASQRSLIALMAQAYHLGLANRAAYIEAGLNWTKDVVGYMYGREAEINALSAVDDVELAGWDYSQFDDSFPGTWIGGAMAIQD